MSREADPIAALRARLPLTETVVIIAGRQWRITTVEDQDALIERVRTDDDLANFPYGLMLWPSALALAEVLAQSATEGTLPPRILEIGSGVGVAGVVSAAYTPLGTTVLQTDYEQDALTLAAHNARINGVPFERLIACLGDWRAFPDLGQFDLVVGADVLYERTLHPVLSQLLPRLVAPGGTVLLSDPLRPQALEWIAHAEKADHWQSVEMTGRRVTFRGESREIALFCLHPSPTSAA